ncbi:MAG TPA: tetratricopeptide repeat protein [Candidatus Thermoplasmatota archaeon]
MGPSGLAPPARPATAAPHVGTPAAGDEGLARARAAYAEERFEDALALYDALLAQAPSRAVYLNDRGVTRDALRLHAEAEQDYRAALAVDPEYELAQRNLANCLVFQGREGEAVAALERALTLRPAYEGAWRDLLGLLLSRGPAAEDLEVAKRLAGSLKTPFARFVHGVIAAELGRGRVAVRELRAACGAVRDDAATRAESGDGHALLIAEFEKAYGNALFSRDDIAESVNAYRRSVEANPADEETWNNLGFAYFTAGENDLSIECFRKSVEVRPDYKHAWYNLAYTYQAADRLEEAIVAYDRTLECDPTDEVAWNNRGNAEYNLGRYDVSIPFFEKAVELQPDYDIAWNNIGNALNKVGRHAEAIPFHERALMANPRFDYAWYAIAKSRFHTGDVAGAVRDIEECLRVNAQFDAGWALKAEVLLHLGDVEEALEASEQAVAANPLNDHAHFVQGEVLEALGRTDAAQAAYGEAIAIAGDNARQREGVPDAWTVHGEMLLARDRFKEAAEAFQVASTINPSSQLAREGRADALAKLGRYREALLSLHDTGAGQAPHESLQRIRIFLESGDPAQAVTEATRYRKRFGDEAEVSLMEAEALVELGKPRAAEELLEEAARALDKDLGREREAVAQAQGAGRPKRRRRKAAVDERRAVPLEGPRVEGAGREGRRQIEALQEEGALLQTFADEPLGEAQVEDLIFQVRLLAGVAAREDGRPDDARAHFHKAVKARPDRAEGWYRLGEHALEAGDARVARAHFEAAVGAEPLSELGWVGLLAVAGKAGNAGAQRKLGAILRRMAPGHPALGGGPRTP